MNRRGFLKFLKSLICAIAGKSLPILSALTTPRVAASVAPFFGWILAPYVPLLCTPTFLDIAHDDRYVGKLILSGRLRGSL